MATALDIITKAMQTIGVLTRNEVPASDEATDGLVYLNALLSSWSNESMMIYARTWETFPIVGGTAEYTIGPAQTFNTVRPILILDGYARQGVIDYPVKVIPDEVYNTSIWDKSAVGVPNFINYDNAYPTARIRIWPVPDTSYSLFLLSEKQLSQFTLNQDVAFPPGWELALIYNLALLLAPQYGVTQIDPLTVKIAGDSKGNIAAAVLKVRSMDAQPQQIGRVNIYNGGYR